MFIRHETIEKNVILMLVLTLITVSIGGLVQIIPLFTIESTIERVDGVRPYTPLELMGRNIYVREGCYLCHSQQIRPFKDEVERYGHYSLAAESMYDQPFQWGSKRTGPDLARVGGRYSNDWHVAAPRSRRARSCRRSSCRPIRSWRERKLEYADIAEHLKALRAVGVPYTDEMIANAARRPRGAGQSRCRSDRAAEALSARRRRQVQRRVGRDHRDGCAGRLPADAGNAGALQRPAARTAAPIGGRHDVLHPWARFSPRSGRSGRSLLFAGIVLLGLAAGQPRALRAATPASRSNDEG